MDKDPFKEYIKESEPDIEGEISFEEANALLQSYFSYRGLSMDEIIRHFALFVSRLWQIHAFGEGNTRTTAVFFIKYLRTFGFDVTNDIFTENAWYFRNSLVRANYNDFTKGIHETTEYLELFLRNFLLGEHKPLHNRTLHISGAFKEAKKPDVEREKPDIQDGKSDIEVLKADIDNRFTDKTTERILKLCEEFQGQTIFGRSDVMRVLDMKASRTSELLKEMAEQSIIEPVSGFGKGKYRFRILVMHFPSLSRKTAVQEKQTASGKDSGLGL